MDKTKLLILAILSAVPGILEALKEYGLVSGTIAAVVTTVIIALAGFLKPPKVEAKPILDPIADLERSKTEREKN